MEGWVSIHRKITQWQWYSDANTVRVFIHLLIMANHSDGFYQGNPVKRGQRITSPDKIAIELGLSRQKVRTALDKLILTNEITIKATNKFSLITIEKYEFYQSEQKNVTNKPTTKSTNKQPTNNQQITTNNNDNKEDNDNKTIYDELFDHYISAGLINHKRLDESMKKGIDTAIKTLGCDVEEMKRMIDRHKQKANLMKDYPNFKVRKLGEFFGQKKWQSVELICSDYTDDLYDKSKSDQKKQSPPSIDDKPWMMDFKEWQKANGVVEDES